MALNAALDLMRRLPPRDIEKNLENTLALAPELVEDLLSAVDQVCLSFSLLCELS
jgi:capping protein beta